MICVRLEFPLGVYHAMSDGGKRPEWVPSPVRLVAALLAAAEELPSGDTTADRAVLQQICEERPPLIYAPRAAPWQMQAEEDGKAPATVAELRGASRWAPRNPSPSELRKDLPGARTVNVAEVSKGGVAIGEIPVLFAWPELELDPAERERLARMLGDIAWLGTSRSPVLCRLVDAPEEETVPDQVVRWEPLPRGDSFEETMVRVPHPLLIPNLDQTFAARAARNGAVEKAGQVVREPNPSWPYEVFDPARLRDALDPKQWGRFLIVELDRESEMIPRAAGVYPAARAFRAALMDTFEARGEDGEAPPILHGHDGHPHLAAVPLPFAGRNRGDGRVLGFALLYPHPDRAPSVAAEASAVEAALAQFFPGAEPRRTIAVPGAGSFWVRAAEATHSLTLSRHRYRGPARRWATVTPVVHSRWRKGEDEEALAAQVAADCEHVGLPAPVRVERLRTSALRGGGNRIDSAAKRLPPRWRHTVQGPSSHLLLEFERKVVGPVLLGKARHFGLGLCLPLEPTDDE